MGTVNLLQPSYDVEASEGVFDFYAPSGGCGSGVAAAQNNPPNGLEPG